MKTKQDFINDFQDLMRKYDASIEIGRHTESDNETVLITWCSKWDSKNNQIEDFTEIDLWNALNKI